MSVPALIETPRDPAAITYPPTLPFEVILRTAPLDVIREAYHFSPEEWRALRDNPAFVRDLIAAQRTLQQDGMTFITKARLQAEALLGTSWKMIHASDDVVPPSVKADLIKTTIRVAGLDQSTKGDPMAGNRLPTLQIQINL